MDADAQMDALALWCCTRKRKAQARARARSIITQPVTGAAVGASAHADSAASSAGAGAALPALPAASSPLSPIPPAVAAIDATPARRNRLAPIVMTTAAATAAPTATVAAGSTVDQAAPLQQPAANEGGEIAKDEKDAECCCAHHVPLSSHSDASSSAAGSGGAAPASTATTKSSVAWTAQRRDAFWPFRDQHSPHLPLQPWSLTLASSPVAAPAMHPRLVWTAALAGRFHVLLSALRELAPTPNTTWKHDDLKAAHARQLAAAAATAALTGPDAVHQTERAPYRSELLQAVDAIFQLFCGFHAQHSAVPAPASDSVDNSSATPAPSVDPTAALNHLLVHASYLRFSVESLTTLAHFLVHMYEGMFQRLWHNGGRDLCPHLFLHSELSLLVCSFRETLHSLGEGYRALMERAREALVSRADRGTGADGDRERAILEAAPSFAALVQPLSDQVCLLQSLSARLLESARHAASHWCDSTWPELFGFGSDGPTAAAAAAGRTKGASNEGADAWLVRKEMPRPLPVMPNYSASATATAAVAPAGLADASVTTASGSPMHTRNSSSSILADRATPLLLVLEQYFLPLVSSAGEMCAARSGGLVLSRVLEGVLQSFLSFLQHCQVRINAQGAARINVEARWAWRWVHFAHVRPLGASDADPLPVPQPTGPFPHASSAFLQSVGLHGLLSEQTLRWWEQCCVTHCAGSWARVAAVVLVLLQPRSYATGAAASGGKNSGGKKSSKRAHSAPIVQTWSWNASASPSPSPSPEPAAATATSESARPGSNRVAPLPPALAFASPSSSPNPAHGSPAEPPSYSSLTDARGLSLPDLQRWLALASHAHNKDFQPVGNDNAAIVDWPDRR